MSIQHIIVHEIRRVKEEKKSTETLGCVDTFSLKK